MTLPAPTRVASLLAEIAPADAPGVSALPLEHTTVDVHVLGVLASVAVTQRFANPFERATEIVYRFPLPHEGVVGGFELTIGERSVRGVVAEAEQARRRYDEARATGHRAGLATQQRPNLYEVRIANVQPGESIRATYRFHQRVALAAEQLEIVLPFGWLPRYRDPADDPEELAASRVEVVPPGIAVGLLDVRFSVDAGAPITAPTSPSHALDVTVLDDRRFAASLPAPVVPNRDLVLRYAIREPDAAAGVHGAAWRTLAGAPRPDGTQDYYVLATVVPPPVAAAPPEPPARELVFVMDRSGSMSVEPMAQARNALRAALRTMRPDDTFRLIVFDDQVEQFRAEAVPATAEHVRAADAYLGSIDSRGGTRYVPALTAALADPVGPGRQRIVVFFTDGGVAGERRVLTTLRDLIGSARLFTFGIGDAINRSLLSAMARVGRGSAEYLQAAEDIQDATLRFQDALSFPELTDVTVDWGGCPVADQHPARVPDLYHHQVLTLAARLTARPDAPVVVTLRGRRAGQPVEVRCQLPAPVEEAAIGRLWAKEHVDEILDMHVEEPRLPPAVREDVIRVACAHGIMTAYTSFVAVDDHPVAGGGTTASVTVPQALADSTDPAAFGLSAASFAAAGAASPAAATAQSFMARMAIDLDDLPGAPRHKLRQLRQREAAEPGTPSAGTLADLVRRLGPEGRRPPPSSARPPPPSAAGPPPPSTRPADLPAAGRAELHALAATQDPGTGAWGDGPDRPGWTAAALVAFARQGETPERGPFRVLLRRALDWLEGQALDGDDAALRAWARAEIDRAGGRPVAPYPAAAASPLQAAVRARLAALGGGSLPAPDAAGDPRVLVVCATARPAAAALAGPWLAAWRPDSAA
jgi:Ca-activated chloride channel family protein